MLVPLAPDYTLADWFAFFLISASSLGMMSDEEKKLQRIEDIKELLS